MDYNTLISVMLTAALSLNNNNEVPKQKDAKNLKNDKSVVFESKKNQKRLNQKINQKVNSKKYDRLKGSKDTK